MQASRRWVRGWVRAEMDRDERRSVRDEAKAAKGEGEKEKPKKLYTFSHAVMIGIMIAFFAGAGLGAYAVLANGEPVEAVLDYIMELAHPVGLAYLGKAFGENLAKIIMSAIYGRNSYGGYSSYGSGSYSGYGGSSAYSGYGPDETSGSGGYWQ